MIANKVYEYKQKGRYFLNGKKQVFFSSHKKIVHGKIIFKSIIVLVIVQLLLLISHNCQILHRDEEFDLWTADDGEVVFKEEDRLHNFTNSSNLIDEEPPRIPKQIVILDTRYDTIHDLPSLVLVNIQNTIDMYLSHWDDDLANRTKTMFTSHYDRMEALLDSPRVWYLNNTACIKAINDFEPRLLKYFKKATVGQDKANICRVAALYLRGGYYFDTDMQAVKPVSIEPHITFQSPWEAYDIKKENLKGVFNSFVAVAPSHPIMNITAKYLLKAFKGSTTHHLKGTGTLYQALKEFTKLDNKEALSISKGKMMYRNDHYNNNITGVKWPIDVSLKEDHLNNANFPSFPRHENVLKCYIHNRVWKSCCCDYIVYDMYKRDISFYSRMAGAGNNCMLNHTIPQRIVFVEPNSSSEEDIPEKLKTKTSELKKQYPKNWDDEFLYYKKCQGVVQSVEPKLYQSFMAGGTEYKQKVCKLSYLYAKGGYFYDTDALIEHPLIVDSQRKGTTMFFAIKRKSSTSDSYELDDSFLAVSAHHPFLRIQLDLLVNELSESHMNIPTTFTLSHEEHSVVGDSNNMLAFERFYAGNTKGFRVSDWPVELITDHITPTWKIQQGQTNDDNENDNSTATFK